LKVRFVLPFICLVPAFAFGQTSNMISLSSLRQESEVAAAYSRSDIHRLMKTAHTPEDFGHLADYFERQAEIYAAKYDSEQTELDRLLALRYHARSYPAQLEGTRNRMEHFKALSRKCSEEAAAYRLRMKAQEGTGPQAGPPSN
jgi:hypothetical protein